MTHYVFAQKEKRQSFRRERWETFAAFTTFAAVVALAGATYGSLLRGDVYAEVQDHQQLNRFAGMLESTSSLNKELENEGKHFTIIAPTDRAFSDKQMQFSHDDGTIKDKRIVRIGDNSYVMQSESYVVRSQVMPSDVPVSEALTLPTANGETVQLTRSQNQGDGVLLQVNDVPVRERIVADNGIIYLVDELIYPLPQETE